MKDPHGKKMVRKMSKEKKVDYIDLNMAIYRKDQKKISPRQLNKFLDKFLDMVESQKMLCGGGVKVECE